MIAYASRTGTRSTLRALRESGWRLLVSAAGALRTEGFPYALDNGAWSAHQQGTPFDHARYWAAVDYLGAGADFVVLPDIVAGGERSLEATFRAMRRTLDAAPRALIAVQNGVEPWQVHEMLGPRVGVFVGGDTIWKLATLAEWAEVCAARGAVCHVGRVNTARRIAACALAGVASFDGTSAIKFPSTLARLARATVGHQVQGKLALTDVGMVRQKLRDEMPWWDGGS